MDVEDVRKALLMKKKKEAPAGAGNLVGTGSTLLNLACTGKSYGGFKKGTYVFVVGDSASGKTWLTLTCFAEAAINPAFDGYRFIQDDAENGSDMDKARYFGKAAADRIEPPAGTAEEPVYSSTVEEFYYNVNQACKAGTPFIYVLDSMDVLSTEDEDDKVDEQDEARTKGKEAKGTYGTSKAKLNSTRLRTIVSKLRKTGSILIIISQTRDNIGFGAMFNPKTRSGGHALKFYAHLEMWTSKKETIKSGKIRGKERQLGLVTLVKVKKNRHTGKEREVQVPIYHSFGIDDIGSCVTYLLDEGHWKKSGGTISAPEFDFKGYEAALCKKIDGLGRPGRVKLRKIVAKIWNEIEAACKLERTSPYGT